MITRRDPLTCSNTHTLSVAERRGGGGNSSTKHPEGKNTLFQNLSSIREVDKDLKEPTKRIKEPVCPVVKIKDMWLISHATTLLKEASAYSGERGFLL